jgi:hypothetical protein
VVQLLYSLAELADALGVNRTLVALKVKAGLIPYSYQVRDEVLFTQEELDALVEQERVARQTRQERAEQVRQERIARRDQARQERALSTSATHNLFDL